MSLFAAYFMRAVHHRQWLAVHGYAWASECQMRQRAARIIAGDYR